MIGMTQKCGNCKFHRQPVQGGNKRCARFPPSILFNGNYQWPITDAVTGWCGEWVDKTVFPVPVRKAE